VAEDEGLVSVTEAARRLNRTPEQVTRYLREGRLQGRRIDDRWYVSASELPDAVQEQDLQELPPDVVARLMALQDIEVPPANVSPELQGIAQRLNFSWVEERRVAGCRGPRSQQDLADLASLGVDSVVRLAETTGVSAEQVAAAGLRDCHEPVADFTAPSQEQVDRALGFMFQELGARRAVVVSCGAGQGRTGTLLACYLTARGYGAERAIELLTRVRPQSQELLLVPGQKEAVIEFGRRLDAGETHMPAYALDLREREGGSIAGLSFGRTHRRDQGVDGYPDGVTISAERGAHGAELHLTYDEAREFAQELIAFVERVER
jgi:atypical dual specificity phosphatase